MYGKYSPVCVCVWEVGGGGEDRKCHICISLTFTQHRVGVPPLRSHDPTSISGKRSKPDLGFSKDKYDGFFSPLYAESGAREYFTNPRAGLKELLQIQQQTDGERL